MLKLIFFINLFTLSKIEGNVNEKLKSSQPQKPSIPINEDIYTITINFLKSNSYKLYSLENLNLIDMSIGFNKSLKIDMWQMFLLITLQKRILILETLKKNPILNKTFDSWDVLNIFIVLSINLIFNNFFINSMPDEDKVFIQSNLEKIFSKSPQSLDKNLMKNSIESIVNLFINKYISNVKVYKNNKVVNIDPLLKNPQLLSILVDMILSILEIRNNSIISTILLLPEKQLLEMFDNSNKKNQNKNTKEKTPSKEEKLDEDGDFDI